MLNKKDLYIHKEIVPLTTDSGDSVQIGISINTYEVTKYIDVQNLVETNCYIVNCTQRIIIPNQNTCTTTYDLGIGEKSYNNYPALLSNKIDIINDNGPMLNCYLLQYNPKTLNTAVMTDMSESELNGLLSTLQHTSGSTISQMNSYSGSVNLGTSLESPSVGASTENLHSTGKTTNQDVQSSNPNSMSIKDWGSYAIIDKNNQIPTWVWGQEYPWNVIQFNKGFSDNITLPQYVQNRLCDGIQLYPPTQLSLFSIDFVSQASWLVQVSNSTSFVFFHTIHYYTASHTMSGTAPNGTVTASLNQAQEILFKSSPLDLALLALDAITNSAATGFTNSQFTVLPPANFEIVSRSNNLLVRGKDFKFYDQVGFTDIGGIVATHEGELDIYFKITDNDIYTLFIKCWKIVNGDENTDIKANCILNIVINNNINIVKNVNDVELAGGNDNIISLALRNNDYTSADYYDYLQYGLNHIHIDITTQEEKPIEFFLRTIAIG